MNQPWSQFFLTWLPIKVVLRMKMMKILVYRVWTQRNIAAFVVNFHCATNAHLQMKMTKFQVGKLESLLRIVCLAQKRHTVLNTFCRRRSFRNFWSKGSIFTVSFTNEHALSWARACFSDMHESSLLTYYHNPSVFHCQRPCNGTAGKTLILPWKTTAQQDHFFHFFDVAVRFDWIKIDVWLKLGVLNYSSQPKLLLKWYYDKKIVSFFFPILKAYALNIQLAKFLALCFIRRLFILSVSFGFDGPPLLTFKTDR